MHFFLQFRPAHEKKKRSQVSRPSKASGSLKLRALAAPQRKAWLRVCEGEPLDRNLGPPISIGKKMLEDFFAIEIGDNLV